MTKKQVEDETVCLVSNFILLLIIRGSQDRNLNMAGASFLVELRRTAQEWHYP